MVEAWHELTKLQKILFVVIICLVITLLVLLALLIFLLIRTDVRMKKCKTYRYPPKRYHSESLARRVRYLDIVNDTSTTVEEEFEKAKPFIVSIHYKFPDGRDVAYCVGSIISRNCFMTSSICVHRRLMWKNLYARAGSIYHDKGGTTHGFSQEVNIPDWRLNNTDYYTYRYMAVVKVVNDFPIDNLAVSAAMLPRPEMERYLPNHRLYTVGWGTYISMKVKPMYKKLRPMASQMYDSAIACRRYLQDDEIKALMVIENVLCAGDLRAASKDQCNIDTGAPLTHLGIIRGVSWSGMSCKNYPTVYAKISLYATWISEIISD